MSNLLMLAVEMVVAHGVRQGYRKATQAARKTVGFMVAAVCAVAAIGCGLAAVWSYAFTQVGPIGAPLIVAGILFVMGGAALAILWHEPKRQVPQDGAALAILLGEAICLLKAHQGPALIAALLASRSAGRRAD